MTKLTDIHLADSLPYPLALGQQKGRLDPSAQAIEKWEDDLTFLDEELLPQVERDK